MAEPKDVRIVQLLPHWDPVTVGALKVLLSEHGLHIVTDADKRVLEESIDLWEEWCSVDITSDDDRWANFTNRVHAMLARRGENEGYDAHGIREVVVVSRA